MSSSDGVSDQPAPRSGPRATYPTQQSPRNKRRWFIALCIAVVVAGLGIAYASYQKFADPDVSGQATGYDLVSNNTVAVQYTVNRNDPSRAVACVVRARAQDGSEVGRREVLLPPDSQTQIQARTEVRTSSPGVIGEVFGCTANPPAYLKGDK